jgi:hypothetical protein
MDASRYLGNERLVGRKLDEVVWEGYPEIQDAMKKEPDIDTLSIAQEITPEWRWM